METYSLRIENLLCSLSNSVKGTRNIIANNLYEEIFKVLFGRISNKELLAFEKRYSGIRGKNILSLCEENYNFETLIFDLKQIIKNNKSEN